MKTTRSFRFTLTIFFSLIFSIISFQKTNAQQIKNETSGEQDKKKITLFFEKVYLHTDRSYYSSGDDIWFKAYLVNGISNIPMETSKNLYVDLISSDAKIIDHKLIRMDMGLGNGDFNLSDSIPGGTYKLRAYTYWMRNFGDIFLFEKEIKIFSTLDIKQALQNPYKKSPTIQFFPESGSLITEAINNIAFKAIDENGKGCLAEGVIISSENDTVCSFNSTHLGMGTFGYMPLSDKKYYAIGTFNKNIPFKTELPMALRKGYSMRVYDYDTTCFYVNIYTNQTTLNENPNARLIISCMSHSKNCFTGAFKLNDVKKDIRISKKGFPGGITSITLYDSLARPHCQRLINISKKESILISLNTNKQIYKPREKVTVNVKVKDINGLPAKTNLSLAVVDYGQIPDGITDIVSYLLLESEVKGKIEQPKNYFDPNNPLRYKQLDLLLLTQGWRDFIWRRIRDSVPVIKYMVEPGITLSGKVRQKFANNPIPNSTVTLYIPKTIKNKLLFTETNKDGYYYLNGIEFYGRQNVILTSSDEKGKNRGWILLDNPDTSKYPIKPFISNPNDFNIHSKFSTESAIRKQEMKKYSLMDTIHLDEVVISASKIKQEKILKNHFAETGSYPDHIYNITEADYGLDLGNFLLTRVPKARPDADQTIGGPINRVLFNVMGDDQAPRFIVDGRTFQKGNLADENFIYNIPLEGIDQILVSYNDIIEGNGSGVAINIITNPNASQKTVFYTINKSINGYYEARTFYSPVYPEMNTIGVKSDLRSTLYWNPKLITDEKGECTVTYYNSDKITPIKISIEGLTDTGTPLANSLQYEIK
jgi:hypothetical protein